MASTRFRIRVDMVNDRHVQMSLFDVNGANCGIVTVAREEAPEFLVNAWTGTLYYNKGTAAAIWPDDYGADTPLGRELRARHIQAQNERIRLGQIEAPTHA